MQNKGLQETMVILIGEFLMVHQFFSSPQVKRSLIISNKSGIYQLPNKLQNDLRLRIIRNWKSSE